jgi:hypothetical protein
MATVAIDPSAALRAMGQCEAEQDTAVQIAAGPSSLLAAVEADSGRVTLPNISAEPTVAEYRPCRDQDLRHW